MAPSSRLLLLVTTLLIAAAPAPSLATKFDVGGKQRWAPNVNYTTWADQQQFHVGDWLNFVYEKGMYDVVQVSDETAYDRCNDSAAVLRYSRGTNFVFQLNRTGRFYFICSRGYCWNGMKLSVLVQPEAAAPPAAPPSEHASRAPSSRARAVAGAWVAALAAASLSLGPVVLQATLPFRV